VYVPEVLTGRNDRCCSDHRSFYEVGFSTTDFSDTHGPIVDPMYHNSGDLVNRPGYDLGQYHLVLCCCFFIVTSSCVVGVVAFFDLSRLAQNTKAIFATLIVVAGLQSIH
jgi:uncharacterized membrane protein